MLSRRTRLRSQPGNKRRPGGRHPIALLPPPAWRGSETVDPFDSDPHGNAASSREDLNYTCPTYLASAFTLASNVVSFSCRLLMRLLAAISLIPAALLAQAPAVIRVNLAQSSGPLQPIWSFFGHDEPNYTYMKDGRKLLSELAALSPVPVYMRVHSLLVTGDGKAALKWGSTNAYTEDASGKPVYDWTITDRIFDTYMERKMKPLVQIGFMPQALSTRIPSLIAIIGSPATTTTTSTPAGPIRQRTTPSGRELVYQWATPLRGEVRQAGSESRGCGRSGTSPTSPTGRARREEYHKLYDYSADAVKRALPTARVGGDDSTGPAGASAAAFLRDFLEHVAARQELRHRQDRLAAGFRQLPRQGRAAVRRRRRGDGNPESAARSQRRVRDHRVVPRSSKNKPIIIGESDPEGCAACSSRVYPQNAYRNGADVSELHGRCHAAPSRPGGAAWREPAGRGHLGIRIRRPAVFRRLPRPGDQRRR